MPFRSNTVHLSTEPRDLVSRRGVTLHLDIDTSGVHALRWTALYLHSEIFYRPSPFAMVTAFVAKANTLRVVRLRLRLDHTIQPMCSRLVVLDGV